MVVIPPTTKVVGFLTTKTREIEKEDDCDWVTLRTQDDHFLAFKASLFLKKPKVGDKFILTTQLDSSDEIADDKIEFKHFEKITIGININDSESPWTELILAGKKTIETRNKPTLHPYLGKRVGIVKTGKGKALLVGFVTILFAKEYQSLKEFRGDKDQHLVKKGSKFDFKSGKFGYYLSDPKPLETPVPVTSRGIVSRKINFTSLS